jgi:hypothetical protein
MTEPARIASPFDRTDADENVRAAGLWLNEPEAFRCIEPGCDSKPCIKVGSEQSYRLPDGQQVQRRQKSETEAEPL